LSASPERTLAGATSASKASYSGWASRSRPRRSARPCAATGLIPLLGERPQPGGRSCADRPPGSWPATSSPSIPSIARAGANANAYAERWVGTVRAACLDWLLIVGRDHLEQVLRVYVQHYNQHRPHRALSLQAPDPPTELSVAANDRQGKIHTDAIYSAACSTSTGELHERINAPHGTTSRR
jgi:Integrase core domain